MVAFVFGLGDHVAGVGAIIGSVKPTTIHSREPFLEGVLFPLLRKAPDRVHGKRALHGSKRRSPLSPRSILDKSNRRRRRRGLGSRSLSRAPKNAHLAQATHSSRKTPSSQACSILGMTASSSFSYHVPDHDFFFGQEAFNVVKIESFKRLHGAPSVGCAGASSTCPRA